MPTRVAIGTLGIAILVVSTASLAFGYIHFPPMTVQKMCQGSHHIRVLKIEKVNKEKGVIFFEVADALKGKKSQITSLRHVIRSEAEGAKPILDWAANGKTAVMFSIEGNKTDGAPMAVGYVFIDKYCYSADYYDGGKYWLLIRGEPDISACYHGSAEQLRTAVKDILAGKEVKVPVKEPDTKENRDKRTKEVNDILKKNR
jgi:hypothetical protein